MENESDQAKDASNNETSNRLSETLKKRKQDQKFNLYCCKKCDTTDDFKEMTPQDPIGETHVEDWHIREWNVELRENDICMDELNFERKMAQVEEDLKIREAEHKRREDDIRKEQREIIIKKKVLEDYEKDLKEKEKWLEISERTNDIRLRDSKVSEAAEMMSEPENKQIADKSKEESGKTNL